MSKQILKQSKLLSKNEVKNMAKKASLEVLNGIAGYADMICRLKGIAENEGVAPLVQLNAIKEILKQHNELMNFEAKVPQKKKDLSDVSDDELEEILALVDEQAHQEGILDIDVIA